MYIMHQSRSIKWHQMTDFGRPECLRYRSLFSDLAELYKEKFTNFLYIITYCSLTAIYAVTIVYDKLATCE